MTDNKPADDFDYGEQGPDGQYENYPTIDDGEFEQAPRRAYTHADGCGETTTVSDEIAESIARDPEYYTKTFCAGCGSHVPVSEVEWKGGEDWIVETP